MSDSLAFSRNMCFTSSATVASSGAIFFTAEAFEIKSSQSEKILQALKSPYGKATLQFMEFVLDEFNGLNVLFQANEFKLHRLLPEVKQVLRMLCLNFMRLSEVHCLKDINVEDRKKFIPLSEIYPGILASETIKIMLPH